MKFYLASRTSKADEIKEMAAILEQKGCSVSHDWTNEKIAVGRPYPPKEAQAVAENDMRGIEEADVFVLLGDEAGTGMYVEMGIALASNCKVYVIGPHNETTVFHFLPKVRRVNTFTEVLEQLNL